MNIIQALYPPSCGECPAICATKTLPVQPSPCKPGGMLVIGEAPGAEEEAIGEGFVGQAGRLVDRLLNQHHLIRHQDYGVANIVACRPPENRKPKAGEVSNCIVKLAKTIVSCRPTVLLLVGGTASSAFVGAGNLFRRVEESRLGTFNDLALAHPDLRKALQPLIEEAGGIHCVPMPHTSGLAWNRNASNGERWSVIGTEQVAIAASLLAKKGR